MTATMPQRVTAITLPERSVFIDGSFREVDGATAAVVNPATEETIATVASVGAEIVESVLAAARRGFETWSRTSVSDRADALDRIADAMERHGAELAAIATSEIGMPIRDARAGQVDLPVRVLRSTAAIAREYPWDRRDGAGSSIVREAAGVVLAITPWNFPVHQIITKLAPALAAGCSIILKPAELTPLTALFVAALCDEAGIPRGVVNVVTGRGSVLGEALLQSRGYEVVTFTGSLAVGRHIGAVAGDAIVRATLELGGKSPAIVLADADLQTAVETTVRNCFVNAGQKCNAPTRLLVPRERTDEAAQIAARVAESYVIGDPTKESTTMGPMVSAAQRDIVSGFLGDAAEQGARIVTGGERDRWNRGFFISPAIVSNASRDSRIAVDEVFGPVLTVLGYDGEADAVTLANDSEYGLSAEVWSADPGKASAVARQIRAGQVRINGVRTPALPVSPFGGYKRSGLGRELGVFALDEFVEIKAVLGDPILDAGTGADAAVNVASGPVVRA
ncbi:aldehyde dehydrogenase [Subtercola boreus]|uniref:aldehyde dehydrogenase (NAD(+)) n=1 Tax=Subtercola boreus TaxID=120213 RepID=A0A3E0VL53_9MICO|nr:aldehyde dehydrogenase family protein [Subtercola boreus]RFA10379.1 aldehyde dehydrogenase [Subtercola boreus]TQL56105.1 acyl-CoA reductase-like NAD-dependent aldehyde dehydrogenase [Subtercola boreus]